VPITFKQTVRDVGFMEALNERYMAMQFGTGARLRFYEQLSRLLGSQVTLDKALTEMYRVHSRDGTKLTKPIVVVLGKLIKSHNEGLTLADGLSDYISVQERALIAAGEQSGKLKECLDDTTMLVTKQRAMRSAVIGGMMYPIALFAVMGYLLHIVATKLAPNLARLVKPDQATGSVKALLVLGSTVQHYGTWISLGIIFIVALSIYSLPRFTGRLRLMLEGAPPWSIYKAVLGSTFLLNLSVLIGSGMQLRVAIRMLGEHASPWLKERIDSAYYGTRQESLGVALDRSGYVFPGQDAIDHISIIGGLDGFDDALSSFGRDWMDQSVHRVESATRVIFYVGIAFVAFLLLLVVNGAQGIQDVVSNTTGH